MANLQVGVAGNGTVTVGAGASVHSPASNTLTLGTNGDERLRINSSGYIGVNDTSGNARFIISGDSDTSDADCQIRIYDTDTTAGSQIPSLSFWGGSTEIGRIRGTDTSGMRFYTANSGTLGDRMSIGADGNVHINTDDNSTANAFVGDGSLLTGVAAGVWPEDSVGVSTIKVAGINTTGVKGIAAGAATSEGAVQAHGNVSVYDGFIMTDQVIDKHLTLPAGKNAILVGPVQVATGIGVTVEAGCTLLIA